MVLNWIPESVKIKGILKGSAYRPIATFLPPAPKRGTIELLPQKQSVRYEREQKKIQEEESLKSQAVAEDVSSAAVSSAVVV